MHSLHCREQRFRLVKPALRLHADAVTPTGTPTQVRDEWGRHAELPLGLPDEPPDLNLHGRLQRRPSVVRNPA